MSTFAVRHGFPFTFLARDDGGGWHVDSQHLIADLLFWGFAGLLALVAWSAPCRAAPRSTGTAARRAGARADPPLPATELSVGFRRLAR